MEDTVSMLRDELARLTAENAALRQSLRALTERCCAGAAISSQESLLSETAAFPWT
jgi:hypothetical protein